MWYLEGTVFLTFLDKSLDWWVFLQKFSIGTTASGGILEAILVLQLPDSGLAQGLRYSSSLMAHSV